MSRFASLTKAVTSGYAGLAANAVYSFATVPMALHYLADEQWGVKKFALWGLLTQVTGFIQLLDLGMTSATARLIIDHKDSRAGRYGDCVTTGWLVLIVQAVVVLLAGWLLAPACPGLLKVDGGLALEFTSMVRWQSVFIAGGIIARMFNQLLYAHQRQDVVNWATLGQFIVGYLTMWFCFAHGAGTFSVVWAYGAMVVCMAGLLGWRTLSLGLLPRRGQWGSFNAGIFREMIIYGGDVFLVALGGQLVLASQALVISRNPERLGLAAVALWTVGTRLFFLSGQLVWRIIDYAGPIIGEMLVRNETQRLRDVYRKVVIVTMLFAAWAAGGLLCVNSQFVQVWTAGRLHWAPGFDVLAGLWFIGLTIAKCHNMFIILTKQMRSMRYVYLLEGLTLVVAGTIASNRWGLAGIFIVSLCANLMFTSLYGTWRVARFFQLPFAEVCWQWQKPMLRMLLVFGAASGVFVWLAGPLSPLTSVLAGMVWTLAGGGLILVGYALPSEIRTELVAKMAIPLRRFIRPFPSPPA